MSWEQLIAAATAISACAIAGDKLITFGHQLAKLGRAIRRAWLRRRNRRLGRSL